MDLDDSTLPVRRQLTGVDTFVATAGQAFNIETSPDGEEIISLVVPAGKVWDIWINVDIIETDA